MKEINPPDDLVKLFLRSIRNQFYRGCEKLFHQERNLLLQAITYPASYLHARGVGLPLARYKSLLTSVIRTINAHGHLAQVRSPGRYLLHAVQEHMKHQGEVYYDAGKRTRDALADVMLGLKPRTKGPEIQADSPVATLADAHRILTAAKGGRKKKLPKAPAPDLQRDLFRIAKPMQKPPRDSERALKSSRTFAIFSRIARRDTDGPIDRWRVGLGVAQRRRHFRQARPFRVA